MLPEDLKRFAGATGGEEGGEVSVLTATTTSRDLATITTVVDWQKALEIFLNTPSSPQTRRACEWAMAQALEA